jgi:hypothetical protein
VNTSAVCQFYDVVDVPDPSHFAGVVGAQEALGTFEADAVGAASATAVVPSR